MLKSASSDCSAAHLLGNSIVRTSFGSYCVQQRKGFHLSLFTEAENKNIFHFNRDSTHPPEVPLEQSSAQILEF